MRNLKVLLFVLFTFFLINNTYSKGNFSFHFGASLPQSDFGSDNLYTNPKAGGAAVGFNVGIQHFHPLSESGWSLFTGIDFNYNGLQKDYKDDIEDYYELLFESLEIPDFEIKKYFSYINIPVTAGIHYFNQTDNNVGVFFNAGLAFNFLKITDYEIKGDGKIVTQKMDLANNLGLKIGVGIIMNKKTTISVDYFDLGDHDIDGEIKSGEDSSDLEGVEVEVKYITLTLGFRI